MIHVCSFAFNSEKNYLNSVLCPKSQTVARQVPHREGWHSIVMLNTLTLECHHGKKHKKAAASKANHVSILCLSNTCIDTNCYAYKMFEDDSIL